MIIGVRCWISGAWAPSTNNVSTPPAFAPAGNLIDSGQEALAYRSPTISGQRLTIALWTKPKRLKDWPPTSPTSSPAARGRQLRGESSGAFLFDIAAEHAIAAK